MPTIDNKVVQMTFENKQFERGVQQSLHSLDELKKALDLDKSAASLANLEKVAANFDLSGISSGVDKIADKFTLLGNIGQEIFHRISKTAVDAMAGVWRSITSMPTAGMGKYEQKNKAVQMIQSALPDKSLEEIETVLGKLNDYTDLTSYDFSQMAQSIGKFTSAGVDLEVAERAMEGIANETASAGGEIAQANIAMYNFSQALATGSVRLMDWRSIENANLGTKEFKEQIIETAYELGTLGKVQDKVGKTTKGTTVTFENMAQTLQEGWFTSDVLIKVLEKYADRESDVGKKGFEAAKIAITLKQALEAVKDAVSTGWMKSFQYIFGNLEEAGNLFTMISDNLIEFTDRVANFRNTILEGWHTGGEDGISGYTLAVESLSSAFNGLIGITEGVGRAFENVFGVLNGSGLIEATKGVHELMSQFEAFFGYSTEEKKTESIIKTVTSGIEKFTGKLQKGAEGDEVKTLQQHLLDLGMDMVKLDKYGADGIFGPETQAALKAFQESANLKPTGIYDKRTHDALAKALYPNGKVHERVEETTETIEHIGPGLELIQKAAQGVFSVVKAGIGIVKFVLDVVGRIAKMLLPIASGVVSLSAGIGDLISYVVDLASAFVSGEGAMSAFNTFLTPISAGLQVVGGFISSVGEGISNLIALARKATSFEDLGNLLQLDPVKNAMAISLYNILGKIKEVVDKVAPSFKALGETLSSFYTQAKAFVEGKISAAWKSISQFFTNLWSNIQKGDYLTKILNGVASALQVILGIIGGVGYGIFSLGSAIINAAKSLFEFIKNSEAVKNFLASIKKFFAPVGDFFTSFGNALSSVFKNLGKFKNFTQLWNTLMVKLKHDPLGKKFVAPLNKIKKFVEGPIKKIKEFVGSITTAFSLLRKLKSPGKVMDELMKDPEKNKGAINIIKFLVRINELFHKIKPAVENIKSAVTGALGKIWSGVKSFGGSIWGAITDFFKDDDRTIGQRFADFFASLWETVKQLWGQFTVWLGELVESSPFLSSIAEFGRLIGEAFTNFFAVDTSGDEGIFDKLKTRFAQFDPVVDWIEEKIGALKQAFNGEEGVFEKVRGFFSTDENSVLSVVAKGLKKVVTGVGGFLKNNLSWDTVKAAVGGWVLIAVAGALKNFGKLSSALSGAIVKKDSLGTTMIKMAVSIAAIAGALALLAHIDAGQALAGVAVMTVALGAIVGAAVLIQKFAKEGVKNAGIGLAGIAASIGLVLISLWGASKLLESLQGEKLKDSLILVGGILVALGAVAWALSKFGKNGGSVGGAATVLAIAASINLVIDAIGKAAQLLMADYKDKDLRDPILMVGGILVALGAVAVLMAAFSKGSDKADSFSAYKTILSLSYAVSSIVSTIGRMAGIIKQYPEESKHAFWMIEGILVAVGATAVLIAAFSKDLNSTMSSIASVAPILAMGYVVNTIAKTMADCITQIAGTDPELVTAFMHGVEITLAEVGVVAGIFSQIPFTSMLSAAGSLFLVITAIGAAVGVGGTIAAEGIKNLASALWQVGSHYKSFSNFMKEVDKNAISSALSCIKDDVLPMIGEMVLKANEVSTAAETMKVIRRIGTRLMLFSDSISGITVNTGVGMVALARQTKSMVDTINSIQGIDEAKTSLQGLGGTLKVYFANLKKAAAGDAETGDTGSFDINKANEAFQNLADLTLNDETLDKIKGYAKGGDHDLSNFAAGIANLGTALEEYGNNIADLNQRQINKANGILDKVSGIQTALNNVGSWDDLFGILKGKKTDITEFGEDIAELGTSLSSYGNSVSGLSKRKLDTANGVMDAVAKLNTILPQTGGLWQLLAGEQSLGDFAANMSLLGDGMANYANQVSNASFTNVEESMKVIEVLGRVQGTIRRSGGLDALLNGTASFGNLGSGLSEFGEALYGFAAGTEGKKGIKDISKSDWDNISAALGPISTLAEASGKMVQLNDFSALGNGLVEYVTKLLAVNDILKDFVVNENTSKAIDLLDRFVNMSQRAKAASEVDALGQIGWSFESAMSGILDAIEGEEGKTLTDRIVVAVNGIVNAIAQSISTDTTIVDTLTATINSILDKINEYEKDFKIAGENIDAGLAQGIIDNRSVAINAAVLVAQATLNRALRVLKIQSPSQEFLWAGLMSVMGLAKGLTGNVDIAEDAAGFLGEKVIGGITASLSQFSKDSSNDIDAGLSNLVSNFKGAWNEMFNVPVETEQSGFFDNLFGGLTGGITTFKNILADGIDDALTITPVLDLSQVTAGASKIGSLLGGNTIGGSLNLANDIQTGKGVTIIQNSGENKSPDVVEAINSLNAKMDAVTATLSNLRVVMDTNALVGQLAGPMDRRLGQFVIQRGRRG